jgi:hypothetical protein
MALLLSRAAMVRIVPFAAFVGVLAVRAGFMARRCWCR